MSVYLTREELKASLELTGLTYADEDISEALEAASRGIDEACGRRFYPDDAATHVRYYTPTNGNTVDINDLIDLTTLKTADGAPGSYSTTWTENTDFVLEPLNAAEDSRPYDRIRVHPYGARRLTLAPRSVQVTGQFGWAEAPAGVKAATGIIATKLLRRKREAPFGVVAIGLDGEAVRISKYDPDVNWMLEPYNRNNRIFA